MPNSRRLPPDLLTRITYTKCSNLFALFGNELLRALDHGLLHNFALCFEAIRKGNIVHRDAISIDSLCGSCTFGGL